MGSRSPYMAPGMERLSLDLSRAVKNIEYPLQVEFVVISSMVSCNIFNGLCNIFSGFFSNIISELNIPKGYHCFLNDMDSDSVLSVLNASENYPSIKNIKSKKFNSTFSFENTYTYVVMKVIDNLNVAKSCEINDITTKVIFKG